MCRNLILLAKNNEQQTIFTCEHGTIHITHQQTTICMTYNVFLQFAQCVVKGDLYTLNQSSFGEVREIENQQIEMWIDKGGLRMSTGEFFALTALLNAAIKQLERLRVTRDPFMTRANNNARQNSALN